MVPIDGSQSFGSCATVVEQKEAAVELFVSLLDSSTEQWIQLPSFDELPVVLKCMPVDDLKTLLSTTCIGLNVEHIGSYPDTTCLRRKL